MDFFEHQDRARKRTALLVLALGVAVAGIIVSVYFAAILIFQLGLQTTAAEREYPLAHFDLKWDPQMFLLITSITVLIVSVGSLWKFMALRKGGLAVAEMLGGKILSQDSSDPAARRLLNIVEEMAIASGLPVPPVVLLSEEQGINAFAAGLTSGDAVIGVTAGCLNQLTRDELQGVIAHEFSHIVNGDMRLNLQLMAILNGILVIAIAGRALTRIRPPRGGRKDSSAAAVVVFGFTLVVVGYIGVLFGKIIKSAVSRQREFLADAAAVQFTRNPEGIAGALKKIGGFSQGSRIGNVHAEEVSHLFFSNGLRRSFLGFFSTHPPLAERIRRIDPSFEGDFSMANISPTNETLSEHLGLAAGLATMDPGQGAPESLVSSIGAPSKQHLEYAKLLLAAIPPPVRQALQTPSGACAVINGLLLDSNSAVYQAQLEGLQQADSSLVDNTLALLPLLHPLDRRFALPLVEMALPALKQLTLSEYQTFKKNILFLVNADQNMSVFEFALQKLVLRHLDAAFTKPAPKKVRYETVKDAADEIAKLLRSVAALEKRDETETSTAGQQDSQLALHDLDSALSELELSSPTVKQATLQGCQKLIHAKVNAINGAELLRVIADTLDCPMPPPLSE